MSKTTLDKFSSGWHFFCKEDLAESDFSFLSPHHIRFWNRQPTKSQPILQSRYSKKPGSWLNVSCIIHFCNISWMSSPPPFAFPQGNNSVIPWAVCHCIQEKIHFSALGIDYFVYLTYNLLPKSKWRNVPPEHSTLSISHKHSLIIIYMCLF